LLFHCLWFVIALEASAGRYLNTDTPLRTIADQIAVRFVWRESLNFRWDLEILELQLFGVDGEIGENSCLRWPLALYIFLLKTLHGPVPLALLHRSLMRRPV